MATKKSQDTYANIAAISVTESAPATMTSAKFSFPFSIMDKMALVISRIEYWPSNLAVLNSAGDALVLALTVSSAVTEISNQADPLIIDSVAFTRYDLGTAATGLVAVSPVIKDFSDLPGAGIIVAPSPLYGMIKGSGTTPAMNAWIKLFYTYMELNTDEYWQLVESRRIISS